MSSSHVPSTAFGNLLNASATGAALSTTSDGVVKVPTFLANVTVGSEDDTLGPIDASIGSTEFLKNFESLVMRAVEEAKASLTLSDGTTPPNSSRKGKMSGVASGVAITHDGVSSSTSHGNSPSGHTCAGEHPLQGGSVVYHSFPTILPVAQMPINGSAAASSSTASSPRGMVTATGANASPHPTTHATPPYHQQRSPPAYDSSTNMDAALPSSAAHAAYPSVSMNASTTSGAAGVPQRYTSPHPALAHALSSTTSSVYGISTHASPALPAGLAGGAAAALLPLNLGNLAGVAPVPLATANSTHNANATSHHAASSSPSRSGGVPTHGVPVLDPNDDDVRSNLFVCNLPQEVDDDRLRDIFGQFGPIQSAKVMLNIHTGESRGIAFVKFTSVADAEKALKGLNDSDIFSSTQKLIVRVANAKAAYLPGATTNKTFVRNVPTELTKQQLVTFFSQFGEVVDVSIHTDTAGENAAAAAAAAAAGVRLPAQPPKKISVAPILAAGTAPNVTPRTDGSGEDRRSGAEEGERRLNIAFITFTNKDSARQAAEATHKKMPFPECRGIPLLSKVAEDNFRRNERLNRKFALVAASPAATATATTSSGGAAPATATAPHAAGMAGMASPQAFHGMFGSGYGGMPCATPAMGTAAPFGFPHAANLPTSLLPLPTTQQQQQQHAANINASNSSNGSSMSTSVAAPVPPPPPLFLTSDGCVMSAAGGSHATAVSAPFLFQAAAPGTTPPTHAYSASATSTPPSTTFAAGTPSAAADMLGKPQPFPLQLQMQPVFMFPAQQADKQQSNVPLHGFLPHSSSGTFGSFNSLSGMAGTAPTSHTSPCPLPNAHAASLGQVPSQAAGAPTQVGPQLFILSHEQQVQIHQLLYQQQQQIQQPQQVFWSGY